MGRLLAVCGWVAWQTRRISGGTRPSRASTMLAPGLAVVLVVLAAIPVLLPFFEAQPEDVQVQQIFDGTVEHPDGWVRLQRPHLPVAGIAHRARTASTDSSSTRRTPCGPWSSRARRRLEPQDSASVTGTLQARGVSVEEELPIEATVAGTPPRIVPDRVLTLDATPVPPRSVPWPLAIVPILLAAILFIGARVGYPIFRPAVDIDVLANPLSPGERIPSAYGGRIGPNRGQAGRAGRRAAPRPSRAKWQPAHRPAVGRRWRSGAGAGHDRRRLDERRDRHGAHRAGDRAGAPRAIGAGGRHLPVRAPRRARSRRRAGRGRRADPGGAQASCIATMVAT